MARLNLHAQWFSSMVFARPAVERSMAERAVPAGEVECSGSLARLGCDVGALPALFTRARAPRGACAMSEDAGACHAASVVDALEREQRQRSEALVPLARQLLACREMATGCVGLLQPVERDCLEDAMRTLEIEYVRLRDAQGFYFERRLRQARTGAEDDDPEFTVVLECVMYAADQGDDVEASIAQAVQAIASLPVRCAGVQAQAPACRRGPGNREAGSAGNAKTPGRHPAAPAS